MQTFRQILPTGEPLHKAYLPKFIFLILLFHFPITSIATGIVFGGMQAFLSQAW
jgi:hypothetical protein